MMQAVNYQPAARPIPQTVDTKTAGMLMGITEQAVRKAIKEKRLCAHPRVQRSRGGQSGEAYDIPVVKLPEKAQATLRLLLGQGGAIDADCVGYLSRYGVEKYQALMARRDAIEACLLLRDQHGDVLAQREGLAKKLGISVSRLYQLERAYTKDGLKGLMEDVQRKDKGKSRSMCLMAQDYIKRAYCSQGKVGQNRVLENLCKVADKLGAEACSVCPHNPGSLARSQMLAKNDPELASYEPCQEAGGGIITPNNRHAVNRYVATIPEGIKAAGRMGWAYWEAKYMPKALRAKPERVNEVWFGDHHVFDLFVEYQGRPVRPWLTAWMDAKSNAIVGWMLSLNPNSDTIVEALTLGIGHTVGSPYWGVPEMLYIDHGKDYQCKRIEGDGMRDYEIGKLNAGMEADNALLKTLGIGVTNAIPYRPWSKTIERVFGTLETRWIRELPGWCGNGIDAKPEDINEQLRRGELMTYEEFAAHWATVILPAYHDYKAEGQTESPLEIYESSQRAREDVPSWAVLSIAKSLKAMRRIGTTGIRLNNTYYQDPALSEHIGEMATVLYSRQDATSVTVLIDNSYVCEAHSADKLRLVGEDQDKLEAHLREQQRTKRQAKAALNWPNERLRMLDTMVGEIPDMVTATTLTSMVAERAHRGREEAKQRAEGAQARERKRAASAQGARWAAAGEKLLRNGAD